MKMRLPRRGLGALCAAAVLFSQQLVLAQQPQPARKFELTVDSIMRGPALVGYQPEAVRWSQDGRRVFFRWKQANDPRLREMDTYVVERDGTGLRKLSEDEARETAPPTSGDLSKDKTLTVFAEEGDIFVYDHRENRRRQITRTTEAEQNPRFTHDQKRVYFTRQNNLYLLSLDGGSLEQLTDIRVGGGGPQAGRQGGAAEQRGTESQETLKKEERALLEAVRERAENRERLEARRKERERRKPFNLPAGQNVFNLTLSPDGRFVVATVNEPASGAKQTIVPNYVTESAYTEDLPARTKVGDVQGRTRQVVISAETGDVKNVDHGQREVAPQVRTRTEQNASEQTQRERGDAQRPQVAAPRQQAEQTQQQQGQQSQQTGQQSQQQSGQQGARAGERGYALVALLAAMAIIAIVVTSAAPRMQQQAQRELEKESIARGEEVAAALYVFSRAMGRLPTSMDELVNGINPPGSIKTIYILRKSAARDPLVTTRDGEWKLVRQNDRVFSDFILAVTKYNGGSLPAARIYPGFMGQQQQQAVTGLVDLKNEEDEEPPGGEDNESNVSGPFVGVASRSRRKSVLHYYGVERHDRWVFTPLFR